MEAWLAYIRLRNTDGSARFCLVTNNIVTLTIPWQNIISSSSAIFLSLSLSLCPRILSILVTSLLTKSYQEHPIKKAITYCGQTQQLRCFVYATEASTAAGDAANFFVKLVKHCTTWVRFQLIESVF